MTLPSPSTGSTAVVTGASSGIGEEIARELARRGHGVTLVARRVELLESLAADLGRTGVRAEVLGADLSDRASRASLLDQVHERGLVPDILVNNAGLSTSGPVRRADPEAELNMIEVDVAAVTDLCTRFLPGMVERRRGHILNVASTASFQPLPGQAGYGACKAFVRSYTWALVGELRGTGVSATVLCPGPVETGFGQAAGFTDEEAHALPSIMWVTAADVAKAAVAGMDRGAPVVIPGAANRAGAFFAQHAPHGLLTRALARNHPRLQD
ncbi:MAG TPA: SDR family oxidoreductase [Acidimicrobiales bacterium]|jgi:hypothetical protein|nr:SDR family oxidoreductase [Acidimicrobiales bacterium]